MTNLLSTGRLWSRDEVLAPHSPVPKAPGVYAWYFRVVPPGVPTDGCLRHGPHILLYVGIAPKVPPRNGGKPSTQRLFHRIRYHYRGNAEGSTLRLTLGCLLSEELGIVLRRVGSGKRFTFSGGESRLSEWMGKNAFVTWTVDDEPWKLEKELIGELSLPLNLDQNTTHPFHQRLSAIRREAKQEARSLPVV